VSACLHHIRSIERLLLSGPIVRIGPNELHCNDPAFVDETYASSGRKSNKQAHYLGVLVGLTRNTSLDSVDHDLHRICRDAINKFFSRSQITKLEPEMRRITQSLCDKSLSECTSRASDQTLLRLALHCSSSLPAVKEYG